jgi:hypothetical protein
MKLFLSFVLATCMMVTLAGCGSVFFVGGAINPGTSSVIGTVSVVQISAVIGDNGSTVQVTFVTFLNNGSSSRWVFAAMSETASPCSKPSELASLQDEPAPAS